MPGLFDDILKEESSSPGKPTLILPISGNVSSGFTSMRGDRQHSAGDIPGEPGTPVVAPFDMRLNATGMGGSGLRDNDFWSWWDTPYGMVKLAHHTDLRHLQPGTTIEQGQPFTTIGNIINSPHIHMKIEDASGNPIDWTQGINSNKEHKNKSMGLFDDVLSLPQPTTTPPVAPVGESLSGVAGDMGAMGQGGVMPTTPGQGQVVPSIQELVGPAMADPTSESLGMFSPRQGMEGLRMGGQIATSPGGPAHLPTLGMMVGGGLGGITAGPFGAVPGAALGAGAGKAAEMFIQGQRGEKLPSIPSQALGVGKEMLTGASAEMGGQAFGKLAEGAFAPGRKWLEKQVESVAQYRVAQELANQGLPISPTTIAPSAPARAVAWLAERFQPGKSIVDSYRKQTMDMVYEMRRNLVSEMGLPSMGAKPLGAAKEEIGTAFSKFRDAVGPDAVVNMGNTKTFVDNLELTGKAAKDIDFVNVLKGKLSDGSMKIADIEKMSGMLWPKGSAYTRMTPAEKTWREDFLSNLFRDLEPIETSTGFNLAEVLKQAKGTTRDIYQAKFVEGLLDKATNNETLTFNPMQFYDLVRRQESYIQKKLDKDKAVHLFNFADKMKAIAPEKSMFTEGRLRPSMFEQGISSGIPLAMGVGAATSQPALAIPIGFQAIVARSLMNPKGIVRKWLTTGFGPPTLPVKIGIMEGSKND